MSISISRQLNLHSLAKGSRTIPSTTYSPDSRRKKPVHREKHEQIALIEWADETVVNGILVGDYLCHMPNEGKRGPQASGDFVKMGGRRGYPDLLLEIASGGYHGLRIELKAPVPHAAPVTDDQIKWINRLRSQGFRAEVCRGSEEAKRLICEYLASVD